MAKVFKTITAIVFAAHDILGDKTSMKKVKELCDEKLLSREWILDSRQFDYVTGRNVASLVDIGNIGNGRNLWRKKKGQSDNDCRTYETQTRRDMLADNKISRTNIHKADEYVRGLGCEGQECEDNISKMKEFLTNFHSLEQLQIYLDVKIGSIKIMAEV